jgi:hypothetical protein
MFGISLKKIVTLLIVITFLSFTAALVFYIKSGWLSFYN